MVEQMNEITPSDEGRMRASDADRDAVAHRLREALAEGRLDTEEHGERLEAVYRAKTLGELVPITEDLPVPSADTAPATPSAPASPQALHGTRRVTQAAPTSRVAIAVMGGADRSGSWVVPNHFVAATCMGGIDLDLREARFTQHETTIWTGCVMGGIDIVAPDDIEVRVHGLPIMGGFGGGRGQRRPAAPGAPIVHVRGIAVMGGVDVKYKRRKHQRDADG
ncbi:DUF1707 domain-containing protein [Nocardiopsis sp. EMB25]|uniref:DUF1707 SHOCT-like domain-containing protein n=1 Tax=Nocardiopsis sp. EMB25 TaxID=2835867 RepID=UPI00228399EC|nr:DUF1707 domain-containing protein [Nocardiopsis sp. EMB25]MCY9782300.1 DUF1707 domain-containing protein [Nocardiopsis sp. EMB25]